MLVPVIVWSPVISTVLLISVLEAVIDCWPVIAIVCASAVVITCLPNVVFSTGIVAPIVIVCAVATVRCCSFPDRRFCVPLDSIKKKFSIPSTFVADVCLIR